MSGADRSLKTGVKLAGEKDGPLFAIGTQPPEGQQVDVLNVYADSSQQDGAGTLTSTNLSGFGMAAQLTFPETAFGEPSIVPAGISFGQIGYTRDPSTGRVTGIATNATLSTIEVLNVMLGSGNDRLAIQGTLNAAPEDDGNPSTNPNPPAAHGTITVVHGGGNSFVQITGAMTLAGSAITRADGLNWADDGFAIGQVVTITGVTGQRTITAISGAVLTLNSAVGTATGIEDRRGRRPEDARDAADRRRHDHGQRRRRPELAARRLRRHVAGRPLVQRQPGRRRGRGLRAQAVRRVPERRRRGRALHLRSRQPVRPRGPRRHRRAGAVREHRCRQPADRRLHGLRRRRRRHDLGQPGGRLPRRRLGRRRHPRRARQRPDLRRQRHQRRRHHARAADPVRQREHVRQPRRPRRRQGRALRRRGRRHGEHGERLRRRDLRRLRDRRPGRARRRDRRRHPQRLRALGGEAPAHPDARPDPRHPHGAPAGRRRRRHPRQRRARPHLRRQRRRHDHGRRRVGRRLRRPRPHGLRRRHDRRDDPARRREHRLRLRRRRHDHDQRRRRHRRRRHRRRQHRQRHRRERRLRRSRPRHRASRAPGPNRPIDTRTSADDFQIPTFALVETINPAGGEFGGADIINTGIGRDIVFGGAAGDTIVANVGETATAPDGNNVVFGDYGFLDYVASYDPSPISLDRVWSSDESFGGADTITTGTRNDFVFGGIGNDVINAGKGQNIVFGDHGRITGTQSATPNRSVAGLGVDDDYAIDVLALVEGYAPAGESGGVDTITTGIGADVVFGGAAGDTIVANAARRRRRSTATTSCSATTASWTTRPPGSIRAP